MPAEPVFELGIDAGDPRAPGFYFSLPTYDMDDAALTLLRSQAAEILEREANAERTLVVNTFTAIRDIAERRLARRDRYNGFLVRVAIDPTDPLSHVVDYRARTMAYGLRLAEESSESEPVRAFWTRMAGSFGALHFTQEYPRPDGVTWGLPRTQG